MDNLEFMLAENDFINGDEWEKQIGAFNQIQEEERAALRRIAEGLGTKSDAALLARSLGHLDLFGSH